MHIQKIEQLNKLWEELLKKVAAEKPFSLYPIVEVMVGVPALRKRAWSYYVRTFQNKFEQHARNAKWHEAWYDAMTVVMANVPSLFNAAWKLLQPKCRRKDLVRLLIKFRNKPTFRQEIWNRVIENHRLSNLEWWLLIRRCTSMQEAVWKHMPTNFPKRRLFEIANDFPRLRMVCLSVLWEHHLNKHEVARLLIYDTEGKLPGGWRRLRELQPSKNLLWEIIINAPCYKKSAAAHLLRNFKLTVVELQRLQSLVPALRKVIVARLPKPKTVKRLRRTSLNIAEEMIKINNER